MARLSGLPAVVLLLAVGLLMGHAGLDLVQPEWLGRGLEPVVALLVSLILFDGGLNLRLAGRELQRAVVQLVRGQPQPAEAGSLRQHEPRRCREWLSQALCRFELPHRAKVNQDDVHALP